MKFKCPKSFELGPYSIQVNEIDDIVFTDGNLGTAKFMKQEINLQKQSKSTPMGDEGRSVTLWHEIFHWIMYVMERQDLCQDEAFINQCATYFAQINKTIKY